MTLFDPRDTAYHEAAHAVIYLHFEIEIEEVHLYKDGMGMCSVSSDLLPSEGRLLAILAGPEADKVLLEGDLCKLASRESGWEVDNQQAAALLPHLSRWDTLEEARSDAADLVKENWHIISALAELWIQRSKADYDEGENQYCMAGSEVETHVAQFSAS